MHRKTTITPVGQTPVAFSTRYRFDSGRVGTRFIVDIAMPAPYLPGDAPWPVVLVTDGNLAFATAATTAGILPVEPGGPRAACVVGIGYELAGEGELGEHLVLRNRDLTPVRVAEWESRMQMAPPPFRPDPDLQTGGGEAFVDFLLDELLPWLEANFPIDRADCTFAGNSLGALLALHTLFTRPGAFARYLAISPSLWWADRYLFSLARNHAEAHDDLAADLYLCVGGAEELQAPEARMVSDLRALAEQMVARGYPSLRLKCEVLPGESHVSVFNAGFSNGLRHLLGAQPWPGAGSG